MKTENSVQSGSEQALREAQDRMPLQRVLRHFGHGPINRGTRKAFTCPHCHRKGKAGLFRSQDGAELHVGFASGPSGQATGEKKAMTAVLHQGEGYTDRGRVECVERHGPGKQQRRHKTPTAEPRLCWTRRDLVQATGLSYRTIFNLEARGLLQRLVVGVNVAVYTDASVRALFGAEVTQPQKAPSPPEPEHHLPDYEKTELTEPGCRQRADR